MNKQMIQGLKLISWQIAFAKAFESLKPNSKLVVKSSRQKGKSTMLGQALLYCAINHPGSESYMISPTNNQCKHQYKELVQCIENSPLVSKTNETAQEIHFTNGSVIYYRSAESGDSLRGYTVKRGGILCIDEAAFIKDDTIALLLPYVNVSKAPILMVSTPRRESGTFWDWWNKACKGAKSFHKIDVNEFDNSFFISDEQIETYRSIMSSEKFKNEILGLFTTMNEGVFGDITSVLYEPEDTDPVYIGIDWSASGQDETVVTGFNKDKQQCLLWRDKDLDPLKRCEAIAQLLNGYSTIKTITVEKNSIGDVYSSLLKSKYNHPSRIREFTTSNTSKRNIIEKMIELIGNKTITLLEDQTLLYQFNIFTQMPLSKGNYTYAADPKCQDSHDDIVMATALAIDGFSNTGGVYALGGAAFSKKAISKERKYS